MWIDRYHFTREWRHFYSSVICIDFTAEYKINNVVMDGFMTLRASNQVLCKVKKIVFTVTRPTLSKIPPTVNFFFTFSKII